MVSCEGCVSHGSCSHCTSLCSFHPQTHIQAAHTLLKSTLVSPDSLGHWCSTLFIKLHKTPKILQWWCILQQKPHATLWCCSWNISPTISQMSARGMKVPHQHSLSLSQCPPSLLFPSLPLKKNFKVALKSGDPLRTKTDRHIHSKD